MSDNFRKRAEELLNNNEEYARTGCTLLDCIIGGGMGLGIPYGRIVNFVGDKSSGKTFLSNELIARNYYDFKKSLKWKHDDAESGYTFDTTATYGVNIADTDGDKSRTVEELDVNLYKFLGNLKKDQRGIYVVDSLDGLANADVMEREESRAKAMDKAKKENTIYKDKGTYSMSSQKFLSQEFFRTKASALQDKKGILVFISQIRDKIDASMFEKKWTRAGGKALDFYAHSVLVLAQISKIKIDDKIVGVVVRAKLDKSKTPRPYRQCDFSLYFDYGIDDIGTSLDFLFDLRGDDFKLTKRAQNIRWDNPEVVLDLATYTEWLKSTELYEIAREAKREATGKPNLSVSWIEEWIDSTPEIKDKAIVKFGNCYTRDELIAKAEEDPEFKREIEIRTIAKWEEMEDAIRTKRKAKYQ